MSKARLVITALFSEGLRPAEVAERYGVHRAATINRILTRAGAVVPDPSKRPKSSYIRFEASLPNETWQSDFTHYRLTHRGRTLKVMRGDDVEIITWVCCTDR